MEPATPMSLNWLEFKNVEIIIGNKVILKNISLELGTNEHTVVLGPNGSGKSTLINTIGRVVYPIVKEQSYLKLFNNENINLWELREKVAFVKRDIDLRINKGLPMFLGLIKGI